MAKKNDPDALPMYSTDLVKLLDKQIPPRCAARGETQEDIWRYSGMRQLVDSLLSKVEDNEG
jgi:hypothetical protein